MERGLEVDGPKEKGITPLQPGNWSSPGSKASSPHTRSSRGEEGEPEGTVKVREGRRQGPEIGNAGGKGKNDKPVKRTKRRAVPGYQGRALGEGKRVATTH